MVRHGLSKSPAGCSLVSVP